MPEPYQSMFTPQEATSPVNDVLAETQPYREPLPTPVAPRPMGGGGFLGTLGLALQAGGAGLQGRPNPVTALEEANRHQANTEFQQRMQIYHAGNEERRLSIAERAALRAETKDKRQEDARQAIGKLVVDPPTKDVPTGQVGPDGQPTTVKQIDEQGLRQQMLPHLVELSSNPAELKNFVRGSGLSPDQLKTIYGMNQVQASAIGGFDADRQLQMIQGMNKLVEDKRKEATEQRNKDHQQYMEQHTAFTERLALSNLSLAQQREARLEKDSKDSKPAPKGTIIDAEGKVHYADNMGEFNQLKASYPGMVRLDHGSPAEKVFGAMGLLHTHIDQALDAIGGVAGGDRNRFSQMLNNKISELANDPQAVKLFQFLDAATPVATSAAYTAQAGSGMRGGYKLAQMLKSTGVNPGDTLRTALESKLKPLAEIALQGTKDYGLPSERKAQTQLNQINSMLQTIRPATAAPSGRVTVVAPNGQVGHIPADQVDAAIKAGYKRK